MTERDTLTQTLRPAVWGAVAVSALLAMTASRPIAGGFLAGALWNVLNLVLLTALTKAWAREQGRRALRLLLVKLLILYPVGLALVLSDAYSLLAILTGFSWVFLVMVVVAARASRTTAPLTTEPRHG